MTPEDDADIHSLLSRVAETAGYPNMRAPTDVDIANDLWGANCGPAALAAVLCSEVSPLRQLFPQFPDKAFTTFTNMKGALDKAGVTYEARSLPRSDGALPSVARGLVQIQWAGPWTDSPAANGRWAMLHSHWIGIVRSKAGGLWIYDVNADHAMTKGFAVLRPGGGGWLQEADWRASIPPLLIADIPRASGAWFALRSMEVGR